MSGIQIAGIVIVLFLILFLKGANKRRDERFRNLGFDGYKGFKESSDESKEQLRSDYERGISEGVLIGREFDETAFNVASKLIDDRYDRLATEYLEKEPFKSLHNEITEIGIDWSPTDGSDAADKTIEAINKLGNLIVYLIKEKYTDEELHHNLPVMREYLGLPKKN